MLCSLQYITRKGTNLVSPVIFANQDLQKLNAFKFMLTPSSWCMQKKEKKPIAQEAYKEHSLWRDSRARPSAQKSCKGPVLSKEACVILKRPCLLSPWFENTHPPHCHSSLHILLNTQSEATQLLISSLFGFWVWEFCVRNPGMWNKLWKRGFFVSHEMQIQLQNGWLSKNRWKAVTLSSRV